MNTIKKTLCEQATFYIKNLIHNGHLRPGDAVYEEKISEQLGISRAPIREALLFLSHEGLISFEAQKSKRVRSLSPQEIRDSYDIAGIMEGIASVRSIKKWTNLDFKNFYKIVESMDNSLKEINSSDNLDNIDNMFHDFIVSKCENKKILHIAKNSSSNIAKFLYYDTWKSIITIHHFYDRHHILVNSIITKDYNFIYKSVMEHYIEIGNMLANEISKKYI